MSYLPLKSLLVLQYSLGRYTVISLTLNRAGTKFYCFEVGLLLVFQVLILISGCRGTTTYGCLEYMLGCLPPTQSFNLHDIIIKSGNVCAENIIVAFINVCEISSFGRIVIDEPFL